jgi:hypothetical protein
MAENSAEKRESFERWVASLKSSDSRASDPGSAPGSSPGSSPGSNERPVSPEIAPFDERATTVHRIPKDMIQKLRAREATRSTPPDDERDSSPEVVSRQSQPDSDRHREITRSLAEVDTDSTAVFVPPPELLLRAKRLNSPPKKKEASSDAITEPPQPDFSAPAPNLEPPSLDAFLRGLPPIEESGARPRGDLERQDSQAPPMEPVPAQDSLAPGADSRAAWESAAPPAFHPSRKRLVAWSTVMVIMAVGLAVLAYWKLHGFP